MHLKSLCLAQLGVFPKAFGNVFSLNPDTGTGTGTGTGTA